MTIDVITPESTTAAGPTLRMVEVALIEESQTNPRKHFDQERLRELADSIKASGVHQPILLRRLPSTRLAETFGFRRQGAPLPVYELVAGARRLRACRLAKVAEVPAMIRELTDTEALEIQVIENLQREDVTELEEAEGYEVLMRTGNITADEVGSKIGKSRSYVYSRLKVLDICQVGRQALREGKLDFSKALLVARIPSESQQLKAIKDLTDTIWNGELRVGARQAADHIRENYMLALDKAPFSRTDAELLPAAGACATCPKRTGANPELFSDVKSADVCTDAPCYHKKEEAHAEQLAAEARARGQTVIVGKEADELQAQGGYGPVPKLKGYRRLDSAEDSPTDQPLRKIIGKQMKAEGIEPVLIENPRKKGDMIACLPNEIALRLLKTVEVQATAEDTQANAGQVTKAAREMAEAKRAAALAKAEKQYEQGWRDELLARVWAEVETGDYECFSIDVHRYLVKQEATRLSTEQAERIAARLGLGKVGAHSAIIDLAKTTPHPDHLQLHIVMERASSASYRGYGDREGNEGLMLVGRAALLDKLPQVINQVQADAKAKYLPEPVKPAAPEGASTPSPAAHASTTRAKAKGKNTPAAQARATAPKTSKAEASAQIAAALRDAESDSQAPAAQGDEAQAVPAGQPADTALPTLKRGAAAQAPDQAPTAQGDEAQPALGAGAAPATPGQDSADAKTGAAVMGGEALAAKKGDVLRIKDTCDAKSWRGRKVTVLEVTANGFKVRESDKPPAHAERGTFYAEDLEPVEEQAQAEAPAAAAPITFDHCTPVRVKADTRGPNGKRLNVSGRVGVVANQGGHLFVHFGAKAYQVHAALKYENLEAYIADPRIGSKVRVIGLRANGIQDPNLWAEGEVQAISGTGWVVNFPGRGEMVYQARDLEVLG